MVVITWYNFVILFQAIGKDLDALEVIINNILPKYTAFALFKTDLDVVLTTINNIKQKYSKTETAVPTVSQTTAANVTQQTTVQQQTTTSANTINAQQFQQTLGNQQSQQNSGNQQFHQTLENQQFQQQTDCSKPGMFQVCNVNQQTVNGGMFVG